MTQHLISTEGWRDLDTMPEGVAVEAQYRAWNKPDGDLRTHIVWKHGGAIRPFPKTEDDGDEAYADAWRPMPDVLAERDAVAAYLRSGGNYGADGAWYAWDSEMRSYAKGFADDILNGRHLKATPPAGEQA